MMRLSDATAIYIGGAPASRVYLGADLVWSAEAPAPAEVIFVGATSHWQDASGPASDLELALPAGSQAGDLIVISNPRLINAAPVPVEGSTTILSQLRLNGTVGSNYNWGVYTKILDADDITAGHIVTPFVTQVTGVGALVFRDADSVVIHTEDNIHRSSGLSENAAALPQETATRPGSIAVSLIVRGGGLRTTTWPEGWTPRIEVMDPSTAAAGRIAVLACTRPVDGESPDDLIEFSGAADMHIISATLIIQPEAAP